MNDMGGNSDVVNAQLAFSDKASQAGVAIVPDCGLGPGMGTSLALYAMDQLDEPIDVFIWECGLPQEPQPPWNYRLTFSMNGLSNEYCGDCLYIRDWKTVRVPTLEEVEVVQFPPPIGDLEAFTTSGGITTAAQTFAGKLQTLQIKTLRYPGHIRQLLVIKLSGLLDPEPMDIDGFEISPRQVLHALWEHQIRADADTRDLAILCVLCRGKREGQEMEVQVDFLFYHDEATDLTAMEQGTGYHTAIIAAAIAQGSIQPGVIELEKAMSGAQFVEEAPKRGFDVQLDIRNVGEM